MKPEIDEAAAIEWLNAVTVLSQDGPKLNKMVNAAHAALAWKSRAEELAKTIREGIIGSTARVCSHPACNSAIIRRDDGHRYCAAGHPARWVQIDELDKAVARAEAAEAERDEAKAKLRVMSEAPALCTWVMVTMRCVCHRGEQRYLTCAQRSIDFLPPFCPDCSKRVEAKAK